MRQNWTQHLTRLLLAAAQWPRAVVPALLVALLAACGTEEPAPPSFLEEDEDIEELDVPQATDAVAGTDAKDTVDAKDTKDVKDTKDTKDAPDLLDLGSDQEDVEDIEPELPPVGCVGVLDCIEPDNPCEQVDCLPAEDGSGSFCVYSPKTDGVPCDDGSLCTQSDSCAEGKCAGTPLACIDKDDEPCTFATCDPAFGCITDVLADFSPCSDGNLCTEGDSCLGGTCYAGETNKCGCVQDSDCNGFDDGDLCNGTLACIDNYCQAKPGSAVWFSELKKQRCDPAGDTPCKINACEAKTGKCAFVVSSPGTSCEDGDSCTVNDVCADGLCVGVYSPVACDDDNPCTSDSCNGTAGCINSPNTFDCDDGNACTLGDKCKDGVCGGVAQGFCDCLTDADCAANEDGNLCNGTLKCIQNLCIIDVSTIKVCTGSKVGCSLPGCDKETGECIKVPAKVGKPCTDNSKCTVGDACDEAGLCQPGPAANCNDNNPCTDDACVPQLGCQYYNNQAPCDDGEVCTGEDKCAFGSCQPGASVCDCKSDNDCSKFGNQDKCKGNWFCDSASKKCVHDPASVVVCDTSNDNACVQTKCAPNNGTCGVLFAPDFAGCDDGQFCTVLDRCVTGQCIGDTNLCDDGNLCTLDLCDNEKGCQNLVEPLNTVPCNDGNQCTTGDQCKDAACTGAPTVCQDGNPCTNDSCNSLTGCFFAATFDGAPCSDANACTGDETTNDPKFVQDRCIKGKCEGGQPKVCVSQNPCVALSCDPTATVATPGLPLGCGNPVELIDTACDDGNACTLEEVCAAGAVCTGKAAPDCNDNNECTQDACEPTKGCVYLARSGACDDGDACTVNDLCDLAKCKGQPRDCNDENICTVDSCDATQNPETGCVYSVGENNCGSFASCQQVGEVPKCVFTGGAHLVISEVYTGVPGDPSDDWVEIHNPTPNAAQMQDYVLEVRAVNATGNAAWTQVASGKAGLTLTPGAYVLIASSGTAGAGIPADIVVPGMLLEAAAAAPPPGVDAACYQDPKRSVALRLRDVPHQLEHDRVHWSLGALALPEGVTPVDANQWPPTASIERKATALSTRETLAVANPEWLAGNGRDTDNDAADFVIRRRPEPQNRASGQFEPACGGTCSIGKTCNWSAGGTSCVVDPECKAFGQTSALACGAGLECNGSIGACLPTTAGSIKLSEVALGNLADGDANVQFVELYNPTSAALPAAGWVLQWKGPGNLQSDAWQEAVILPLGTTLAPRGYLVVANVAHARRWGGVDVVLPANIGAEGTGGALRLWDPRTGTVVDSLGWGNSGTYTNQTAGLTFQPASAFSAGFGLERKAKADSTQSSMAAGGADDLAGNSADTGNDSSDFLVAAPRPQSAGSGVYEPACNGSCPVDQVCDFAGFGKDACITVSCGSCDIGMGCNPKTGKCDLGLLIAEVATEGPATTSAQGASILPGANEYVLLYNPSASPIGFLGPAVGSNGQVMMGADGKPIADAVGLQRYGTNWTTRLTELDPTKSTTLQGTVPPYGYYLIVPPVYDKNLPTPDHVASYTWDLNSTSGGVRIVRANGKWGNANIRDLVAWGLLNAQAEGGTAAPPQGLTGCSSGGTWATIRRKASAASTAATMASPYAPDFWRGTPRDSNNNAADFVRVPVRLPRSSKCAPALENGGQPVCLPDAPIQRP